jgi:hypothetical protein
MYNILFIFFYLFIEQIKAEHSNPSHFLGHCALLFLHINPVLIGYMFIFCE